MTIDQTDPSDTLLGRWQHRREDRVIVVVHHQKYVFPPQVKAYTEGRSTTPRRILVDTLLRSYRRLSATTPPIGTMWPADEGRFIHRQTESGVMFYTSVGDWVPCCEPEVHAYTGTPATADDLRAAGLPEDQWPEHLRDEPTPEPAPTEASPTPPQDDPLGARAVVTPEPEGEAVEPGDLRAGDDVAYTWRGKRYRGTLEYSPGGLYIRLSDDDYDYFLIADGLPDAP